MLQIRLLFRASKALSPLSLIFLAASITLLSELSFALGLALSYALSLALLVGCNLSISFGFPFGCDFRFLALYVRILSRGPGIKNLVKGKSVKDLKYGLPSWTYVAIISLLIVEFGPSWDGGRSR